MAKTVTRDKPAGPSLITPDEAARRVGLDQVSHNPALTVRKMARRGDLRAVKVSRWTMIDAETVDDLIEGRR